MIKRQVKSDLGRAFLILGLLGFLSLFVTFLVGIVGIIASLVSGAFWLFLAIAAYGDASRTAKELDELRAQLLELQKKNP